MSYRDDQHLSLKEFSEVTTIGQPARTLEENQALFRKILENGFHGICFSAYEEDQRPGVVLTREQIYRRMQILSPHIGWIRSFSCIEGNDHIPIIAKELGIKTLVGAWLGSDRSKNEEEIEALIKLAKKGYVDIAAIGNEVLYRQDLSEIELLEIIEYTRSKLPDNIPVGYVDAYYEFVQRSSLVDASDVILCNCYPYWESCHFNHSHQYLREMYRQVTNVSRGKPVIISETGWPSRGKPLDSAQPSPENALQYFIDTILWCIEENIGVFYFSSFDESWKIDSEGDVGAYWGLWDHHEKLKY